MSDYLTNLIARSFTATPAVAPRVPSLFESSAEEPFQVPQSTAPAAAELPPATPRPTLSAQRAAPTESAAPLARPPAAGAPVTADLAVKTPGSAVGPAPMVVETRSPVAVETPSPVVADTPLPPAPSPAPPQAPRTRAATPTMLVPPPSPAAVPSTAQPPGETSRTVAPASFAAVVPARQPTDENQPLKDQLPLRGVQNRTGARLESACQPVPPAAPAPHAAGPERQAIQSANPPPTPPEPERKLPAVVPRTVPRGSTPRDFPEIADAAGFRIPSRPAEPPPSAPAIHVTIGRVEVRAVPPPAPKSAQPARPKLSLDEYLAQRAGGSR